MTKVQKLTIDTLLECITSSSENPHHNLYICVPQEEHSRVISIIIKYIPDQIVSDLELAYGEQYLILKSSSKIFLTSKLYSTEILLTFSNFLCSANDDDIKRLERAVYNAAFENGEFVEPVITEFYDSFEIVDEVE